MPRRNRRTQSEHKPWRQMTTGQLDRLARFAAEHLSEHARARAAAGATEGVVMSGSECPLTGVRFLSVADDLDPRAVLLAAQLKSSDRGGNLVA